MEENMSRRKKLSITTIFVFTFFILLLNTNIFSYWYLNYTELSYGGDGESSTAMSGLIIDGCGYFLESHANTLLFMKKIEWSGKTALAYDELKNLVDKALDNMKSANETYVNLKQAADAAPYNPAVIDALKHFDYNGFKEANSLNGDIFKEVKGYLAKGDIRGVYARILLDTENIILLLERIRDQVDAGDFPIIGDVWNLNHAYSQSLLFGQYTSQVLASIINNHKK
jgi:hypothetical protein